MDEAASSSATECLDLRLSQQESTIHAMHLLPHLPRVLILDAYARAAGKELEGKADSPESSSALVANAFGWFLDRPQSLPPLPGLTGVTWPARVTLEANVRFPWRGGLHPWLDVLRG